MEENHNASLAGKTAAAEFLDRLVFISIISVFFLVPVFFTGLPAQGLSFEKMAVMYFLTLIGLVAWVAKGMILGELNLKRTPLDLPLAAVALTFAVATALSVGQTDSLIGSYGNIAKSFSAIIVYILFYYLLVNNVNATRIKAIFWSLVVSGSLVAVFSLLQINNIFILPAAFAQTNSFNPIGSISSLAAFLITIFPLVIAAASQTAEINPGLNKKFSAAIKSVAGLILVVILATLALLNGFTFWPAAIVGMVILLMFLLSKVARVSGNNLMVPLGFFFFLVIFFVLGNFNLINLNLPSEVSLSRGVSWDIAKENLKADPIFGSGPSTFYYSFSKFKGQSFNASPLWNVKFDSPSGLFMETLSALGIAGTLAFVVALLTALSVIFISLIKSGGHPSQPILLGLFVGIVPSAIIMALFTVNSSLITINALLLALALAIVATIDQEKYKTLSLSFRASPKYALSLAAIFLAVSASVAVLFTLGLKMYMADVYARQSVEAGDIDSRIEKLNKAIAAAPYQDSYHAAQANNYVALANQEVQGGKDEKKISDALALAIAVAKKSVELAPNKPANSESLALIYENAFFYSRDALEWSKKTYEDVMRLDPDGPLPYLRIALINMARSNAETDQKEKEFYIGEAIKYYDQALAKKSDFSAAYYGKAIAQEKTGNLDGAIEQLDKAVASANNNSEYLFELGRLLYNRGVSPTKLSQNASADIVKSEGRDKLSVEPDKNAGTVGMNQDLTKAEQIFTRLANANPKNTNALYSLAILYQKTGKSNQAKPVVKNLLDILPEDQRETVKGQFPELY